MKNKSSDLIVGRLIDEMGDSIIKGRFNDKEFICSQEYYKGIIKLEANYNPKNKFWEGKYTLPDKTVGQFCSVIKQNISGLSFDDLDGNVFLLGDKVYEKTTLNDMNELNLD